MDRLEYILQRMPSFYNTSAQDSVLRTIINALTSEISLYDDKVSRVGNAIGINTTTGSDIDTRWGSLLNIMREYGESDDDYRNRLKTSIIQLQGGTALSLRHAVSIAMGITNSVDIQSRIRVYDAWECPTQYPSSIISTLPGNVIALIDTDGQSPSNINQQRVNTNISIAKAAGVNVQVIYDGYDLGPTYNDLYGGTYYDMIAFNYNE